MRIAIAGGPKSGKTTLAGRYQSTLVLHTDDYLHLPRPERIPAMLEALSALPAFVVEGTYVPQLLEAGLEVDEVVWLRGAHQTLSKGQMALGKGCATVFDRWAQKVDCPVRIL